MPIFKVKHLQVIHQVFESEYEGETAQQAIDDFVSDINQGLLKPNDGEVQESFSTSTIVDY